MTTDMQYIQQKGNCRHTVDRAFRALKKIEKHLSAADYNALHVALSHAKGDEGAAELNSIIHNINYRS